MQRSSRKTEILEQISATHLLLEAHLSALSESEMLRPGVNGDWTVKDVLAHVTWWEQHLLRRLRTGVDDVYGENMSVQDATDQANRTAFLDNRARPLPDVIAEFNASYAEVLGAIEALTEEEVAPAKIYEVIAWDTFRHYPEHTAMLKAWLGQGSHDDEQRLAP